MSIGATTVALVLLLSPQASALVAPGLRAGTCLASTAWPSAPKALHVHRPRCDAVAANADRLPVSLELLSAPSRLNSAALRLAGTLLTEGSELGKAALRGARQAMQIGNARRMRAGRRCVEPGLAYGAASAGT